MTSSRPARNRKTVPRRRVTEKATVNFFRAFFERHSQIYLEVGQGNDFGKDAYVDLVEDGSFTGLVVSIQVKGGPSHQTSSEYYIPYSPSDRNLWVDSSGPVFGIVYDEEMDAYIGWT